jgi:DNA-binding transcriptional LysR family regulator
LRPSLFSSRSLLWVREATLACLRPGYNPARRNSNCDREAQVARIGDRGEMEAFVRSIELGSFSASARELKLTPSAVSKLVTRLEGALKVKLLSRTTRKLVTTAEGELFLARCRTILGEMEDAESEVGRSRERPRGRLRMHVGVGFATHQVVPAMPRFCERYPEVQVELVVEDKTFDLVRDGIDISVRPGPPADTSLVARTIFEFQRIVCASPDYLKRHGTPRSPQELSTHTCIAMSGNWGLTHWRFDTPSGQQVVDVSGGLSVNNAECVLHFALQGSGIVRLNEFIIADAIRKGQLVPVLEDFHCADPVPMVASYPHLRHRLPRVAAMLDFLVERFAHAPWRATRGKKTKLR